MLHTQISWNPVWEYVIFHLLDHLKICTGHKSICIVFISKFSNMIADVLERDSTRFEFKIDFVRITHDANQRPVSLTIFLPAIHIRWKFRLAVIPLLAIRSQQIFAHATTAQLSCHVQNFVAITVLESRWEWNEISNEFELRSKNREWNGALLLGILWHHTRDPSIPR